MEHSLRIQPSAEDDISGIFEWYEKCRTGFGAEFLIGLDHCFARITKAPLSCAKVHYDIRRALLRRFPYCVYFVVGGFEIVVLAVLHGRRNPLLLQQRLP